MSRIQRFGRPGGGDERVVILPSRAKLVLLAAGSLTFVAVGVWMVASGLPLSAEELVAEIEWFRSQAFGR